MTSTEAPATIIRNVFIDGRFAYTTTHRLGAILSWHEGLHGFNAYRDGNVYLITPPTA